MKSILSAAVFFAISVVLAPAEEEFTFKRLKGPPDSIEEEFFRLGAGGSVKVDDVLIQKIIFEYEEGKSHGSLRVVYKNTTPEALSPKYTIRLYNPYGIFMGGAAVPANPKVPEDIIKPQIESARAFHLKIVSLDSLFRHADTKEYPPDFFKVSWLSISDIKHQEGEEDGDAE